MEPLCKVVFSIRGSGRLGYITGNTEPMRSVPYPDPAELAPHPQKITNELPAI